MKTEINSPGVLAGKDASNRRKWTVRKICRARTLPVILAFALCLITPAQAIVYISADNGTTNLFGTLDPTTGVFTQTATTTPTFYALTTGVGGLIYGADLNSGNLYTVSPSGATAQVGTSTAPDAFFGLAYSGSGDNFLAENLNSMTVDLYSVATDGNSNSFLGQIAGPNTGFFPTGSLTFGPGGNLYFNYRPTGAGNSTLFTVDPANGMLTQVGSGLEPFLLCLFYDGSTLYGINDEENYGDDPNIGVYTIDTTTGVATQISSVTGLPGSNDYYVDAAVFAVPEGSASTFLFLGLIALLGASRLRRRRRCIP